MKKLFILLSLTIFCIIPLVQSNSQEKDKEEEAVKETDDKKKTKIFKLDDMVITGTKTMRKLGDVPASISVLKSEDIETSAVTTLDKAMEYMPGVQGWRARGMMPTMSFFSIRGIGTNRTLFYVDGINLVKSYRGNPNFSLLPMRNIESIEMLRGPYSALYGGKAMGGVVNITTKKPKEGWHASAGGEYGDYNYYKIPAIVSWGGKKFAFSINASYKHIDNYMTRKQVLDRYSEYGDVVSYPEYETSEVEMHVGWKNWNKYYTKRSITTKLYFTPKSGSKHILTAGYKDSESGTGYTREYLNIDGYSNIKSSTFNSMIFAGLSGEQKLPWKMRLDYRLSFHHPRTKRYTENMNLTIPMHDQGYTPNESQWRGTPIFYRSAGSHGSRDYEAEFLVSRPFTLLGTHTITLGYEFVRNEIYENIKEYYTKVNLTDPMSIYLYQNSVYIQDEWRIIDRLLITVGARADFFSRYKSEVSPKAGLLFDIHKKTKTQVFGSIATAYNPPTNYLKFSPPWCMGTFTVRYGNPVLRPERANSGEIGIRSSIKEMLYASIAGFWTDTTDLIGSLSGSQNLGTPHMRTIPPFIPVQFTFGYEFAYNMDKATSRGIEVETEIKFLKYHKVFANYSYIFAISKESLAIKYLNNGMSGWRLERQARNILNLGYRLNWPIHKDFSCWFTAKTRLIDKRWMRNWTTGERKWINVNPIFVADLSAGVKIFRHGELYFHATNLFDIKYKEFSGDSYPAGRLTWFGAKLYI